MSDRASLVFLPGLLCDPTVWAEQADALADRADILTVALFGAETIGTLAAEVLGRAPARFALAGHSMGGRVALEVVRQAPERVAALALLDTGVHPRRPNEEADRRALVELARRDGMAALARRWLPPMVHPGRHGDVALMERLAAMVCRANPDDFERQVRALLDRPDATGQLAAIRCPTLVLCGRQDAWSPLHQHEAMAAAIPGATLRVIEECGHMSTVERPDAVAEALGVWIRSARRSD